MQNKYLYLLTQTDNNDHDAISECIVCANNDVIARMIHPQSDAKFINGEWHGMDSNLKLWNRNSDWAKSFDTVTCKLIGYASDDINIGEVIMYNR